MNSYLDMASKYLSGHKKKTGLTIVSVVLAVTLVVGIFSMLDSLVKFEKAQVLKREGNYHILVRNPTRNEINFIKGRIDVENSGTLADLGEGTIDKEKCALGSIDAKFAANLNFLLTEGSFPMKSNEILLEKWYMDKSALKTGDIVTISLPDGKNCRYIISGIISDWGVTKAAAIPFAFLSEEASEELTAAGSQYFILFKDGVNILNAEKEITAALTISEDRIGYNEGLLALLLQTKNNRAMNIYAIGVVLFGLVLLTAVVMIYNTFNISVMDRVRQFGLLRCIGASKKQMKRLVRRESLIISVKAIPFGVLAGIVMTFAGSAILKYFNNDIYGDILIFNFSALGIAAGVLTGIMTVFIASFLPAKKAARISPVNAITGSSEIKTSKRSKRGFLMKFLHAETAIGVNNAISKKRTLILMSCSIAISILLFFGFSVLVNPVFLGVRTTKAYTADISFSSNEGMSRDLLKKLSDTDGVKKTYGRMSAFVSAGFDASRLTTEYKSSLGNNKLKGDGLLTDPEKSWLVSYDEMQLIWAKDYLSKGTCDEYKLNEQNGIIAVNKIYRNEKLEETTDFQIGDKVSIETNTGAKEFTVMGVMDTAPYSTEELTMTTFIVTEKLFQEVSEDTLYKTIDIQLNDKNQEQTVSKIKEIMDKTISFSDKRQFNTEADNAFMTVAVFIYGFLGVIVLISVLNIINTMNTSIASKMEYLGTMRAIGMSGKQLNKMVLSQAITYSLTGCITGCILGIFLQKKLLTILGTDWIFPVWQVVLTLIICIMTAALSVISPLKRIRAKGISETITSL
jgi:putative ABC transport system permease protein